MTAATSVAVGPAGRVAERRAAEVARRAGRLLAPCVGLGLMLTSWQLFAHWGWLPMSASSPSAIFAELRAEHSALWGHTSQTLSVTLKGYLVSMLVAFALAGLTAALPVLTEPLLRVAVVTYSLPLLALAPVLVVWLGTGDRVRITIAAIAGFFPIMVGCTAGFRAVDAGADELFRLLAARRSARFRRLVLPGALPYVFAGMKISAAAAVVGTIIAEWTGAERGLGVLMTLAMFAFDPPMVWLSLLTASSISIGLYFAVALVERLVVRWQVDRDAVAAGL
ncbi:MAG: ABC transporter permease [Acidimicrobiia bacterium]